MTTRNEYTGSGRLSEVIVSLEEVRDSLEEILDDLTEIDEGFHAYSSGASYGVHSDDENGNCI